MTGSEAIDKPAQRPDESETTASAETDEETCPDVEFNDPEGGCKHQYAARFLAGDRKIPSWVIREESTRNSQREASEGRPDAAGVRV